MLIDIPEIEEKPREPRQSVQYARAFQGLFRKARYKVFWGGRGAAKSWSIARALINKAHTEKHRIGCFRELQKSIKDSVHKLLKDQIELMGLSPWFHITDSSIRSKVTGSEFLFAGLRSNVTEIKSMEGVTIAWVEEAQLVSKDSWDLLIPTIRAEGSEIWVSFNPIEEDDPTYQRFVIEPPPNSIVNKVGWKDNPWFNKTLNEERLHMLRKDPDGYEHVWEGNCRVISDDIIFKGKYKVEVFDPPAWPNAPQFLFGADFGFARDPATLTRSWITGEAPDAHLWTDYAIYEVGKELDDMAAFYDQVPESRIWPIFGDSARPETISFMRARGFNTIAAEKWTGCVEDGIAHIKGFAEWHIHERCKDLRQECRLYRYKRDRVTSRVLPIIIDANNHGPDSIRYSLNDYVMHGSASGNWARL